MAFEARDDWKAGDKYPATRIVELEETVEGNQTALDNKADKKDIPTVPAAPTADTLAGATAVGKAMLKAPDAAAGRAALGAGTSNLKVGTGANDAKAGNYTPSWPEVTGKPTIPDATAAGTRAQLDAGTDTTVRAFSAKDISEYVTAKIAEAAPGE